MKFWTAVTLTTVGVFLFFMGGVYLWNTQWVDQWLMRHLRALHDESCTMLPFETLRERFEVDDELICSRRFLRQAERALLAKGAPAEQRLRTWVDTYMVIRYGSDQLDKRWERSYNRLRAHERSLEEI